MLTDQRVLKAGSTAIFLLCYYNHDLFVKKCHAFVEDRLFILVPAVCISADKYVLRRPASAATVNRHEFRKSVSIKADLHIACRAHVAPMPCR